YRSRKRWWTWRCGCRMSEESTRVLGGGRSGERSHFCGYLAGLFGLAALFMSACARIVDPAEQPSVSAPVVEIEDLAA
ncbi:MAG: hypothetical protein ACRDZ8_06225, partial [Acidimicrobiales bacterium]